MGENGSTDDKTAALASVRRARKAVAIADARLVAARSARDDAIRRAVAAGATERQAAADAGVSPSYAHRAARAGRFAGVQRKLASKKNSKK